MYTKLIQKLVLVFYFSFSIITAQETQSTYSNQATDTITYTTKANLTVTDTIYQTPETVTTSNTITQEIYSDDDLKLIDSLLIEGKFNSPLYDGFKYVLNDKDIVRYTEDIVSTDILKSRLSEINESTPFHLEYNPELEDFINSYIRNRKKYYPTLFARADYYFPLFEKYFDLYDIPIEMKYLAVIESSLLPKIKSRVGATGLWQFMYATAKENKLAINSFVDERQDPEKATEAACRYLNRLHGIFQNWGLALAAYNSGPGNVLKAIKRSGGHKNYWNIRPHLPRETAGYLPAFYATMYIFKYAEELGIYPEPPKFYDFQTDTIQVKKTISFEQVSQKTGIDLEVLSFLNPSYKMDVIPYSQKKLFTIRLPRNKIIDFLNKESEIYALADEEDSKREKPLPQYLEIDKRIRYKVKSGDFLGKIANKFGVRVKDIQRWNNMRGTKLSIGQRLYIHPKKI